MFRSIYASKGHVLVCVIVCSLEKLEGTRACYDILTKKIEPLTL
jgi:hypothetical protein